MLSPQPVSTSSARLQFARVAAELQGRYGANTREIEPRHYVYEVLTSKQRSQVVHLLLVERSVDGQDASRVVAHSPVGPVPPRYDLETLLRWNAELDEGAICIEDLREESGEVQPYFTVRATHLLASADFTEVWDLLEQVARVADAVEMEIYARDLY